MKIGTTYYFEVEGAGTFPVDMLRYDGAWPRDEADSALVQQHAYSEPQGRRVVRLASTYTGGNHHPCSDRWRSFGWQVIDCDLWNFKNRRVAW